MAEAKTALADLSAGKTDEANKQTGEKDVKNSLPQSANGGEKRNIPDIKPGMTIRVFQKIKEKNPKGEIKERIQYFEGLVLAVKHGKEIGASITVRKVSDGIGVEKIFPLHLPTITKIEIKRQARVRRAKLYFLKKGYKKKLKIIQAPKKINNLQ